jgi:hypothetical protein
VGQAVSPVIAGWSRRFGCGLRNVGQPIQAGVSSSDMHSRGASPPWTVMTGTIRLGKGVRREAGSEES